MGLPHSASAADRAAFGRFFNPHLRALDAEALALGWLREADAWDTGAT
jgi:hypothetical protein